MNRCSLTIPQAFDQASHRATAIHLRCITIHLPVCPVCPTINISPCPPADPIDLPSSHHFIPFLSPPPPATTMSDATQTHNNDERQSSTGAETSHQLGRLMCDCYERLVAGEALSDPDAIDFEVCFLFLCLSLSQHKHEEGKSTYTNVLVCYRDSGITVRLSVLSVPSLLQRLARISTPTCSVMTIVC
jgi:hypothetical protein